MVVMGCLLVDIVAGSKVGPRMAFRCRDAVDRVAVGSRGACWGCLLRGEVLQRGRCQEAAGGERDRCQGGEMVGSSWMEDKHGLQSWVAILLTMGGQSPSLPADEHCLLAGFGNLPAVSILVLVVGAADVQSGAAGWVGEAGGLAVGKTLFFQLRFRSGD